MLTASGTPHPHPPTEVAVTLMNSMCASSDLPFGPSLPNVHPSYCCLGIPDDPRAQTSRSLTHMCVSLVKYYHLELVPRTRTHIHQLLHLHVNLVVFFSERVIALPLLGLLGCIILLIPVVTKGRSFGLQMLCFAGGQVHHQTDGMQSAQGVL